METDIYPLHPVKRDFNRYCGPAAVSALCGVPTSKAAAYIREVEGRQVVRRTNTREITTVLRRLGCWVKEWRVPTSAPYLTLEKFYRSFLQQRGSAYLILVTGHWVVVSGTRYVCSKTQEITGLADPRVKPRARIRRIYEIRK